MNHNLWNVDYSCTKIMVPLITIVGLMMFSRYCIWLILFSFPFSGTSSKSSKKDGRRRSNTFVKDRPNLNSAGGFIFHRGFSHEDTLLHKILIIVIAQYSFHWRQLFMIVFPLTMNIKHQNVSSYFTFHYRFSSQCMCMTFYSMC